VPRNAILISTAVASVLVAMNYTRGLVGAFTFMILLATVATLLPYAFASGAALLLEGAPRHRADEQDGGPRAQRSSRALLLVACLAFLYSLWAIAGSGRDAVFWGFLLLMAGVPFYVWMLRGRAPSSS
jgi:APA family basic amino acid/polyamine antiporter